MPARDGTKGLMSSVVGSIIAASPSDGGHGEGSQTYVSGPPKRVRTDR